MVNAIFGHEQLKLQNKLYTLRRLFYFQGQKNLNKSIKTTLNILVIFIKASKSCLQITNVEFIAQVSQNLTSK